MIKIKQQQKNIQVIHNDLSVRQRRKKQNKNDSTNLTSEQLVNHWLKTLYYNLDIFSI